MSLRETRQGQSSQLWADGMGARVLPRFLMATLLEALPQQALLGSVRTPAQALRFVAGALQRHAVATLENTQLCVVTGIELPVHPASQALPLSARSIGLKGTLAIRWRTTRPGYRLDPMDL